MAKRRRKASAKKGDKESANPVDNETDGEPISDRFARITAPRELEDPERRKTWKLPEAEDQRGPYIIELNLQHVSGLPGAANAFEQLYEETMRDGAKPSQRKKKTSSSRSKRAKGSAAKDDAPRPVRIAKTYYRCDMSVVEWRKLVAADEKQASELAEQHGSHASGHRAIYRLWPDFPVTSHVDRSIATIKADAALRSFDAGGDGITWAVIDSGVDANHPHFGSNGAEHLLLSESVADLHRSFVSHYDWTTASRDESAELEDPDLDPGIGSSERQKRIDVHRDDALSDPFGHGTHVAGIISGCAPDSDETAEVCVVEREDSVNADGTRTATTQIRRKLSDRAKLRGVAPRCKLISLRVLDDRGYGRASDVIRALEYVRERINDNPKLMRVHGVNLSVGYEFDAEMFACGQSPLCTEVNRLVQAGVVVVAAAGNTGYGPVSADVRPTKVGLSNTINDPGNAELAITVGSTHRDSPHTFGVSYYSSKGPTGDGRLKPDLIAPGERITSCAAGVRREKAAASVAAEGNGEVAYYIDQSGTSMAAPHVSGSIAAFLSIRREFIGKPLDVKRIFLESATPLGRERYFEGHGLVDLMRAIQSV